MTRIAIVGIGPWGLCAFERIVSSAQSRSSIPSSRIEIHVVDSGHPGTGTYRTSQPDYLVMNNRCADIHLFDADRHSAQRTYAIGLLEWALESGYRWSGYSCRTDLDGPLVCADDFLPRSLMGRYLSWVYERIVRSLTPNIKLFLHVQRAVDIVDCGSLGESVVLETGETLLVDHVLLMLGHLNPNSSEEEDQTQVNFDAYPIERWTQARFGERPVVVSGMGLVAMDIVSALSLGRGGHFKESGGRLHYLPSRNEPKIHLMSRTGLPYRAKVSRRASAVWGDDPIVATSNDFALLLLRKRGSLDFRRDVLPLLFDEMLAQFLVQSCLHSSGRQVAIELSQELRRAYLGGVFSDIAGRLGDRFGQFKPERIFFGSERRFSTSSEYEDYVCQAILDNLTESTFGELLSPVETSTQVFRLLRDEIRNLVENEELTTEAHEDFYVSISPGMNRIVAGPPGWRLRQLVCLVEAGVVRIPYGPRAEILSRKKFDTEARIHSTTIDQAYHSSTNTLIKGYLSSVNWADCDSPLLYNLINRGRVALNFNQNGDWARPRMTDESHPVNRVGTPESRLWMFGPFTEGTRYFTHYIPSPRRGKRGFRDIERAVAKILN